ncbi:UDP-glucuronosyltransferase 2B19, partial [Temnothorax longispinosus]
LYKKHETSEFRDRPIPPLDLTVWSGFRIHCSSSKWNFSNAAEISELRHLNYARENKRDLVTASKPLSILLIENLPSPSHHIWTEHLVKGLLRKGHHVHAVSIRETKVKGKLAQNLTYAVFDGLMQSVEKSDDYNLVKWEQYSVFYTMYSIYQFSMLFACDTSIKTEAAKELLEMTKTVKFDVIVQDITSSQCFYGLWEDYVGGPNYPTVRPYPGSIAKLEGLWLKTWNVLYYIVDDLIRYYYFLPAVQRLTEEYVGHAIRPLREIEKDRINIVLINSHPAFEPAIPLPPNTLEIAGLNAQTVQPIADEVVVTYPE